MYSYPLYPYTVVLLNSEGLTMPERIVAEARIAVAVEAALGGPQGVAAACAAASGGEVIRVDGGTRGQGGQSR